MKRFLLLCVFLLFLSPQTQAQSWSERQRVYNEKSNLENELFLQEQEMERMRREQLEQQKELDRERNKHERELRESEKESDLISNKRQRELYSRQLDYELGQKKTYRRKQEGMQQSQNEQDGAQISREAEEAGIEFSPMPLKAHTDAGVQKIYNSNRKAILRQFENARNGDAKAQINVGKEYLSGQVVKKSEAQALQWLKCAAVQGEPEAQTLVGRIHLEGGMFGKQGDILSKSWFQRAAEMGYSDGQLFLGMLYLRGRGVSENMEEAYFWLSQAASGDKEIARSKGLKKTLAEIETNLTKEQRETVNKRRKNWKPNTQQEDIKKNKKRSMWEMITEQGCLLETRD